MVLDDVILGYILQYMQTTVIFKTDKKLKEEVQRMAKRVGIPFSALLNGCMRDFVERQEVTFSLRPAKPNSHLVRVVEKLRKVHTNKSNGK